MPPESGWAGVFFRIIAGEAIWPSERKRKVDALEPYGDEGRDKLRKAAGRGTYPESRG